MPALRDHPDPQVGLWLDGLAHTTDLMSHTVGQLMSSSAGIATRLRAEPVDLPRMAQRVCTYYQRHAGPKGIEISLTTEDHMPPVLADRALVAAVLATTCSRMP